MGRSGAVLSAFLAVVLLSACASHQAKDPHDSGELFLPSQDAMADVEAALEKAATEDKLALIVLGANWCHDSRALAARLYQDPLGDVIAEHYETVLVDIGYLDQGRDVARKLGTPIYYATPTVLIADPATGRLVNAADRHQWGAAASIDMDDSVEYFTRMAALEVAEVTAESSSPGLFHEIDAYEERLAAKVARGYERVGPMLRAYKEGGEVPASFEDDWNEVAEFRKEVPSIVDSLRRKVRDDLAAGVPDIDLDFPPVSAYSWE